MGPAISFQEPSMPRQPVLTRSARQRQREIGERIFRLRRERGVSQTELGAKVGVSQRVMSYYENGSTRIPADALLKIADVLKVSVYELLGRAVSGRSPKDKKTWRLLEQIGQLPGAHQRAILKTIDGFLRGVGQA